MDVFAAAQKINEFARLIGCNVQVSHASTGSRYLTLSHDLDDGTDFVVRVADHGECYCREDISCDPFGLSVSQAQEAIAERFGFPSPAKCRAAASRWEAAVEQERCRGLVRLLHPETNISAFVAQCISHTKGAERRAWQTVKMENQCP